MYLLTEYQCAYHSMNSRCRNRFSSLRYRIHTLWLRFLPSFENLNKKPVLNKMLISVLNKNNQKSSLKKHL